MDQEAVWRSVSGAVLVAVAAVAGGVLRSTAAAATLAVAGGALVAIHVAIFARPTRVPVVEVERPTLPDLPVDAPVVGDDRPVLDRIALEEAKLALTEQVETLERLRTRATGFAATLLVVVAFLIGDQLPRFDTPRSIVFGMTALVVTLAVQGIAAAILWPRAFRFSLDARTLVTRDTWRESQRPEGLLAWYLARASGLNETGLGRLHRAFSWEVALGGLAAALWILSLWR